jgi:hypothetical protein
MKNSSTKTAKRAKEVRAFLQGLLKSKVETKEDRVELSEFLGLSLSSVEKLIYKGDGGLDAFISAVMFALKLGPEEAVEGLKTLIHGLQKHNPVDEADRIWFDLELSKEKKLYYASLIREAVELEKDILDNKKRS